MSIISKRNAIIGWATLGIGKRVARKRASRITDTVTGAATSKGGKIGAGALGAAAAAAGVFLFWRKRHKGANPGA
jgi:hypothetical protein